MQKPKNLICRISIVSARSAILIAVFVFALMFGMFYVSSVFTSQSNDVLTRAKISQQKAIEIARDDLKHTLIPNGTRTCICALSPALIDEYFPVSDFESGKLYLPLEYYHVNGTFYEINATNGTIIGKWDNEHPPVGFQQYNGKFGEFLELGKGRLYWILDGYDENGVPFLYNVDAVTGAMLDSASIRERLEAS